MIPCIVTGVICALFFFIFGLLIGSCLRVGAKADEQSEKALANKGAESEGILVTPEEHKEYLWKQYKDGMITIKELGFPDNIKGHIEALEFGRGIERGSNAKTDRQG